MTYKNLSPEQVKSLYSERCGFVFMGAQPSSEESCEKIYKQIKEFGICDYEPDFINVFNPAIYAFIYPEDVYFHHTHSADFYEFCQDASMRVGGQFQITTLKFFLNNI